MPGLYVVLNRSISSRPSNEVNSQDPQEPNGEPHGTSAKYEMTCKVEDGILILWDRRSPDSIMRNKNEIPSLRNAVIPEVHRWSDVGFIFWADSAQRRGVDVSILKYVVVSAIVNDQTREIIKKRYQVPYPRWDSRRNSYISTKTNLGKAIVASPNIRGKLVFLQRSYLKDSLIYPR